MLGVGADDERLGAVRVDVVGAGLGVVLDHEDRGGGPVRAGGHGLHEPAHRQVVVGDHGLGGGRPGLGALGVVAGQPDELHRRQGPGGLVLGELPLPLPDPGLVGGVEGVAGIGEVGAGRQLRRGGRHRSQAEAPEPVVAVGDPGRVEPVPDIGVVGGPSRRGGQVAAFVVVGVVAPGGVGVVARPGLLHVGVGGRGGGPVPSVRGDLGVGVEVVQGDELTGQRADVGRRVVVEQVQRRGTVALAQAAQHLVIGTVLLHHVDHVLDRARTAGSARYHAARSAPDRIALVGAVVTSHLLGVADEVLRPEERGDLMRVVLLDTMIVQSSRSDVSAPASLVRPRAQASAWIFWARALAAGHWSSSQRVGSPPLSAIEVVGHDEALEQHASDQQGIPVWELTSVAGTSDTGRACRGRVSCGQLIVLSILRVRSWASRRPDPGLAVRRRRPRMRKKKKVAAVAAAAAAAAAAAMR